MLGSIKLSKYLPNHINILYNDNVKIQTNLYAILIMDNLRIECRILIKGSHRPKGLTNNWKHILAFKKEECDSNFVLKPLGPFSPSMSVLLYISSFMDILNNIKVMHFHHFYMF